MRETALKDRTVTFHIGVPKTGSTSIQRHLAANAARLAPELAVFTPVPGSTLSRLAQHAAAFSLKRDDATRNRLVESIIALRQEVDATGRPCLVSHETLVGASPGRADERGLFPAAQKILRLIDTQFAPVAPDYVVYTRDIDTWKHSMYAQAVKTDGYTASLDRFLAETRAIQGWDEFKLRLRTALGDRVTFLDMDRDLDDAAPAAKLLSRAGAAPATIASLEPEKLRWNTRPRAAAIEFLRLVNMIDLSPEQRKRLLALVKQNQSLFSTTFTPDMAKL